MGEWVQLVGFVEDEVLIFYLLNIFCGYCYLQEYFVFQDKFLFVDVDGFDLFGVLFEEIFKQVCGFELCFDICKSGIQCLYLMLENVKLYCMLVVNLFCYDVLLICFDGKQDEYLLMLVEYSLEDCGVFLVEGVIGWWLGGFGYQVYVLFEFFEYDFSFDVLEVWFYYSVW